MPLPGPFAHELNAPDRAAPVRGVPDPRPALRQRHGGSLHRQLLLWLLLPQLVLWIAGGLAAYKLAEGYTNGAVDASLSQASRALARQLKPLDNGLLIDLPRAAQDILEADPNDRLHYMVSTPPGAFILGNRKLPLPDSRTLAAPRLGSPYFYDATLPDDSGEPGKEDRVRIAATFLRQSSDGATQQILLVQVARSRTSREELARSILRDTLLPLAGLMALMSMIVWAGIRAGLAPLARLRGEVEGRASTDLTPIQLESAPDELRSLVAALNSLLAAVQQNMAAQKRFISDAAHQLRTPLAGLKTQAELALQAASDDTQRARLARLHESATRSAHLISQLLTLARADPESAAALGRTRFDLRELAQRVTAELVPRALRADIDLGFDGGPDHDAKVEIAVIGNALLLREALTNLIDNALRYAGAGAGVTVAVRQSGDVALLEVMDDGPGIAPELRAQMFERFVRGTDQGPGCGLGLPIVKEILERQHGSVTLSAAQPRGLCATLRLPLAR